LCRSPSRSSLLPSRARRERHAGGFANQALPLVTATGQGSTSGDMKFTDTFGAVGRTLAAAVGLSSDTIAKNVPTGSVIPAALAT
jgi:hypothetical protein